MRAQSMNLARHRRRATWHAAGFRIFAVLFLTLALGSGPALAKKKKKKKKKSKTHMIEMTGIDAFDAVFKKAKKLDNKVRNANRKVRKSKKALVKALKLGKKSTYGDALKELKKKGKKHIKVAKKGGVPKLSVKKSAPADIKNGVDAVNTLLKNMPGAISDMKGATTASVGLVQEAVKFPDRMKAELAKQGSTGLMAMVTKLPKMGRTVLRNLQTMKSIPGRAADTISDLGSISNQVVKTFK